MNRYSEYDRFARVYNKHWGGEYAQQVLPILENLVLRHLPKRASVLDLCCGTGHLARALSALGYRVTGIDGSEEMLRFARENAPTAEFITADARSFRLPATCHAVVSTYDSLNHIMTPDELTRVFRNVYAALQDGGLFLFDLNMEEGYQTCQDDSFSIIEDDLVCVVRFNYHPEERTARFEATVFHLQEGWQRSDITLTQRCYSDTEVRSSLNSAGFTSIQGYSYDQSGLSELNTDAERAFFICRKPAGTR